jgi:hypothetical protein
MDCYFSLFYDLCLFTFIKLEDYEISELKSWFFSIAFLTRLFFKLPALLDIY